MPSRRLVLGLAAAVTGVAALVFAWVTRPPIPLTATTSKVKAGLTQDVRVVLEGADDFEVLAVICEREPRAGEDTFRGYPVRKRVSVQPSDRAKVVAALYKGLDEAGAPAMCFEPHHAIHARRGAAVVDLVICYFCSQLVVHDGSAPQWVCTSDASRSTLAGILGDPDVPDELRSHEKEPERPGRTTAEWAALIDKARLRRYAGTLDAETRPAVLALARSMQDDPDLRERTRAAALLGRLGTKAAEAAPLVAGALAAAKEKRDRVNALSVLECLAETAAPAVPALVAVVEGADDSLSLRAVDVIAGIGTGARAAAPAILAWSEPSRGEVHVVQGALALARIGASDEATVKALLARMKDAPWNVKRAQIQALGDLGAQDARSAIEACATDPDPRVALSAKVALAQLAGDPASALPLIDLALAPGEEIVRRRFAAADLRRAGGVKAVARLGALVADDADDEVRRVAAEQLGELGPAAKDALPDLEKAIRRGGNAALVEQLAVTADRMQVE